MGQKAGRDRPHARPRFLGLGGHDGCERAKRSSVQVRAQNVLPDAIGEDIVSVLREHSDMLADGAIVTVDEVASRVRILPVRK